MTSNPIELLVKIQADTAGSKTDIQTKLNTLSKELEGLKVDIKLDKDALKGLTALANLDFSKINSAIGETDKKVKALATMSVEDFKKNAKHVADVIGIEFGKISKIDPVGDIEKKLKAIDSQALVQITNEVTKAGNVVKQLTASYKQAGIERKIAFEQVNIDDKGSISTGLWMPKTIKETDMHLKQATTSTSQLLSKMENLASTGKISGQQFEQLASQVGKLNSVDVAKISILKQSFRDGEISAGKLREEIRNIENANFKQLSAQTDAYVNSNKTAVEQEAKKNKELKEQETLKRKLYKLESDLIALNQRNPNAKKSSDSASIQADIQRLSSSTKLASGDVDNLTSRFGRLRAETTLVGRDSMGMMESFKVAMEKFPIWMAASTAFYGVIRTGKEFMSIIIDIDTKMTDIKKVMSSDTDFEGVFDRATQSAERFGQSISQVMDSYIEFAKQGYMAEELGMLADSAVIASNVGDITAQKASEYMTASLVQWKMDAKESMGIIDSWNEISNNYATTTERMAQGHARAGASARAMGLDFDQTNAIIGSVTAATKQSGNEVGNFLKNVLPRLLGKPAQDALDSLNISLTDKDGNLRDIVQVYTDVANAVKNISDSERIAVTEGLAGKFHISRMQVFLDDLGSADSMYRNMEESSRNSAGSAVEENEKYMKSLQARINLSRVEVEKLALAMGDAFLTEGMIQAIQAFGSFLKAVTSLTNAVGALPVMFGTLSVTLMLMSTRFKGLVGSIGAGIIALAKYTTATRTVATANRTFTASLGSVRAAQASASAATVASTAALRGATFTIGGTSTAVRGLSVALKGLLATTGVGLIFVGLGLATEFFMGKAAKSREAMEELKAEDSSLRHSFSESSKEIGVLAKAYEHLDKKISDGEGLNVEELKEYTEIQNELATLLPTVAKGEDTFGNSLIISSDALNAKIAAMKVQIELEERLQAIKDKEKASENLDTAKDDATSNALTVAKVKKDIENMYSSVSGNLEAIGLTHEMKSLTDAYSILEQVMEQKKLAEESGSISGIRNLQKQEDKLLEYINTWRVAELGVEGANVSIISSLNASTAAAITLNEKMGDTGKGLASSLTETVGNMESNKEKVEDFFNAFNIKIDSNTGISKELDEIGTALDTLKEKQIEGLSTVQLAEFSNAATTAFDKARKSLIEMLTDSGIEQGSESFNRILTNFDTVIPEIDKFSISAEDMSKTLGISLEAARAMIAGFDEMGDSSQGAADGVEKLKDVIEEMSGVSQQQIDNTETLTWQYDTLALQLEHLVEGTEEYSAVNDKLTGVKEELLSMYPHLFKAGQIAEQMTYDQIQAIAKEVEANDILRAAYKASMEGKLTSDEKRALSGLQTAKDEIHNINEQIKALNRLATAYGASARGLEASAAAASLTGNSAIAGGLKAASIAFNQMSKDSSSSIQTYEADLASVTKTQAGFIDTLKLSDAVMGNTTTATNKAADAARKASEKASKASKDSTKAQKDANAAMEESIFLADQYKRALEELSLEIKKQQALQEKFPDYSSQYRSALEGEIKLQRDKMSLLQGQAKALEQQIASGKILQTGVVTTSSEKTINPAGFGGKITSGYGTRTAPTKGASTNHQGIDIAGAKGSRLDANVSGKVVFAGNKGNGLGNYVTIQAEDGMKHIYAHLDKVVATLGQTITAGMQVGNIGMTGTATGSHLHYQVNDASGKSVNPQKYIDEARKGISEVSKEVAKTNQDIDSTKSSLIALNGEIIDQQALIDGLTLKKVNSHLDEIDVRRQKHQRIIDYEEEKIKRLDVTSKRYIDTLSLQAKNISGKQKFNQQELDYLNKMISSGTLSAKVLEEMKIKTVDLTREMLALGNELRNISSIKIDAIMGGHTEVIDKIAFELARSEAITATLKEGTADYNTQVGTTISLMKEEQQAILNKRTELQRLIMTQGLHIEDIKKHSKEIDALTLSYWGLEGSIGSAEKSLKESNDALVEKLANDLISAYKDAIGERRDRHIKSIEEEISRENKRHKTIMDNYKREMDEFKKLIQSKIDEIDREESNRDYNQEIDKLEEERLEVLRKINLLSMDDSYEAKSERKKLQENLTAIDETIAEKRHKREIDLRKESLNDILKDKEEEVSKKEDIANDEHDNETERIDKLKTYWNQFYTDQLNDERKFAEIKKQIVAGNFDELSKEFQEYIKEMEDTMPELENTLDGTMEAVGTSIRKNIIETLQEALKLLGEVQSGGGSAGGVVGGIAGAGGSAGVGGGASQSTLSSGDLKVLAGKFMTDKLAPTETSKVRQGNIRDKAHDIASQGRSEGSTIASNSGFDAVLAGLSEVDKVMLGDYLQSSSSSLVMTGYLQDFIKNYGKRLSSSAVRLESGGATGKFKGEKMAYLHEEEVVFNKKETKELFRTIPILDKLDKLLSPIRLSSVPQPNLANGGSGGDTYEINFQVDKMTGNEHDVNKFTKMFTDSLKRNKGVR